MKILQGLAQFAFGLSAIISPAAAQEDWSQETLPPVSRAGPGPQLVPRRLIGNEYIFARCEPFVNEEFTCREGPANASRFEFVPISRFARASTVEALGTAVTGLQGQVSAFDTRLDALEAFAVAQPVAVAALSREVASERRAARKGIAAAVAIGSAAMPSAPGRTSYDFNLATFRGQQAIGGSLKHRLNTAEPLAVAVGFSAGGKGNNAARIGVSGEF